MCTSLINLVHFSARTGPRVHFLFSVQWSTSYGRRKKKRLKSKFTRWRKRHFDHSYIAGWVIAVSFRRREKSDLLLRATLDSNRKQFFFPSHQRWVRLAAGISQIDSFVSLMEENLSGDFLFVRMNRVHSSLFNRVKVTYFLLDDVFFSAMTLVSMCVIDVDTRTRNRRKRMKGKRNENLVINVQTFVTFQGYDTCYCHCIREFHWNFTREDQGNIKNKNSEWEKKQNKHDNKLRTNEQIEELWLCCLCFLTVLLEWLVDDRMDLSNRTVITNQIIWSSREESSLQT